MGQPQLLLAAEPVKADINTGVAFTATLEPPLPKATPVTVLAYVPSRLQASYTYFWGDNSQIGPTDQTNPTHPYGAAGTYNATATAQVGNYQIKSNPVTITVPAPTQVTPTYRVTLKVQPQIVDIGQDVNAYITVEPSPAPGTTYKFDWGDGKQEVRTAPNASHQYSVARKRAVHSTVTIDNQQFHSNPVAITVKAAPVAQPEQPKPEPQPNRWPLIVGVVVAVVLLIIVMGYRLIRRGQKLPLPHLPHGLSITSKRGIIQHEIRNAEKIRKVVGVRIVSGCTSSASMTPSGGIIKKRSASNA
jgi:PKD repeat protein